MRRFFRTVAGKTILFISCFIFIISTLLSVIGICFCLGTKMYTYSKDKIFEECSHNYLISDGHYIVYQNYYSSAISEEYTRSNLMFELKDKNGNVILSTKTADADKYSFSYKYAVFENDGKIESLYNLPKEVFPDRDSDIVYDIDLYFKKGFPENDNYRLIYCFINFFYSMRYWIFIIAVLAFLSAAISFVELICVSARRPDTDMLYPGAANCVPFDLMLAGAVTIGAFIICFINELFYDDYSVIILCIIAGILYIGMVLGLCMSIAARVKQKTLLKNTVIYRILKAAYKVLQAFVYLIKSIPFIWRTAFVVTAVCAVEIIAFAYCYYDEDIFFFFWIIEKAVFVPAVLYIAICFNKLFKAGKELANGNINYKTDTGRMLWDFKRHGDDLNSISYGMTIAVNERLKSERMKTELITNVSHDIKTPITSVINYSLLIKNEPCENPKIKEYADVLIRKSERLKRLTDDLIEASKASTGSIDVALTECDASVLITQAAGEYQQKLKDAELTLITKLPDDQIRIMADGRKMWRIFDNLLNNICKYSQTNTRVYISLEKTNNKAVFSFKNTSKDELDISEDVLMERFVRGDSSRNTDGNGLGLSIAKSLAELQNGSLDISIDGDLFKAVLKFPVI